MISVNPKDYIFDIESYPNFFSCVVRHKLSRQRWIFEVSEWCNHAPQFITFLNALEYHRCRTTGFNNFGYDWQVIEHVWRIGVTFTAMHAYEKTDMIINGSRDANFKSMIWGNQQRVQQLDLMLIHHFDNFAKATSLKQLEFAMRSLNVGDLPIKPGTNVPEDMRYPMIEYNCHDVDETEKFMDFSQPMISFREDLVETMGADVINYNDTKIGKKYFENELRERVPHLLGTYKNKKQTHRSSIALKDVIIPTIEFETPQLQHVLRYLKETTITETKAPKELKDLECTLNGFTMRVGAGGGHGSVERQCVRSDDVYDLIDVDVASYYPNLAIKNRFYPAHLSEAFCDIYLDVYNRRKGYAKKTAPNEMLKLALNGVYGDSANPHSIFLDQQYTMQITINGQLLLYLLTEKILCHTNSIMVQLNTDGITFLAPKTEREMVMKICKWWEDFTQLELEYADYAAMWIRDVNNYMALTKGDDGYLKRIGAYAYETQRENPATREVKWNKDHSALVVQKAACAAMVDGTPVRDFIMRHEDPFDFMLCSKVTGKTRQRLLLEGQTDTEAYPEINADGTPVTHVDSKGTVIQHMVFEPDAGEWLQKVTRYYIAKNGGSLQAVYNAAPAAAMKRKKRIIGKHVGWKIAPCDHLSEFNEQNIEFEWYIQEAEKLVIR